MKSFELLISYRVIESIDRLPRKTQIAVRQRFLGIRDFPQNHSDFSEADPVGRKIEINIFGKFAIRYWIDEATAQIKIWIFSRQIEENNFNPQTRPALPVEPRKAIFVHTSNFLNGKKSNK